MKEYVLKLYVSGETTTSQRAISTTQQLCDEYLTNNYELEVIDVWQYPEYAEAENITTTPALIRYEPGRIRRFIGDSFDQAIVESIVQTTANTTQARVFMQMKKSDNNQPYRKRVHRNIKPTRKNIKMAAGSNNKILCRDFLIKYSIKDFPNLIKLRIRVREPRRTRS